MSRDKDTKNPQRKIGVFGAWSPHPPGTKGPWTALYDLPIDFAAITADIKDQNPCPSATARFFVACLNA